MPSMLEKIYEFVQKNGPTLPVEVASKLNTDSLLASAYLSQLVESGKLVSSKEKVGGAMLYFLPGLQSNIFLIRIQDILHFQYPFP